MGRWKTCWFVTATVVLAAILARPVLATDRPTPAGPVAVLRSTEEAFARAMAERDHEAFRSFLAHDVVFFNGAGEIRGEGAVAAAWKPFFEGPSAPFSWQPEIATVLDSGSLGLTSGPVFAPDGERIGTFNSVWRREPDGSWKIVFDRGCPECECSRAPQADANFYFVCPLLP